MTGYQLAELTSEQAVLAQRQPGLGLTFQRGQPLLLQPRDRRLSEHGVGEVRQRRAPPQRQRIGQQGSPGSGILARAGPLHKGCEPALVHRLAVELEQITRWLERHPLATARLGVLQRLPQPADLRLQGPRRMDRKVIAPQIVDQPVRRYRPAEVEEKVGQQRTHLDLGNRDQPAILCPHCQGPEHAETHQVRIARDPGAPAGRGARGPTGSRPTAGRQAAKAGWSSRRRRRRTVGSPADDGRAGTVGKAGSKATWPGKRDLVSHSLMPKRTAPVWTRVWRSPSGSRMADPDDDQAGRLPGPRGPGRVRRGWASILGRLGRAVAARVTDPS